jgi:hypothetical protein
MENMKCDPWYGDDINKRVKLDQSVSNIVSIVENAIKNYEALTLSDAYKVREFLKMVERFIELSIDVMEFEARNNSHELHKQVYYERLREELNAYDRGREYEREYEREREQAQDKEEKE